MRARQGLANLLWKVGRTAEAAAHFRELLRLNPGDNQGIRYSLLNLLLDLDADDEARTLLKEYDDGMAEWLYTRALLAFRESGAGRKADAALKAALKMNRHVPAYLTGRKRLPASSPPYIGFGDDNEAQAYAAGYLKHWRKTPGAVEWLKGLAK
jgi:tetratricopeptide (TPR) repeat protein